jgi:cytochrome c oxidase subunit II
MTQAVARGWSRWIAGVAMGAALGFFAAMAFGQDSALVAQGKQIFNDQGCYGCHTMGQSGTPIAPDLSKIGSKHSEEYLRRWLEDPKAQKPTAHMPKLALTKDESRALAAYLASLR